MINKKRENKKTNSFKNLSIDCSCSNACTCRRGENRYTETYNMTEPLRNIAWSGGSLDNI